MGGMLAGIDITVTEDPTFQTTEFDIHTATGPQGPQVL